ncbi:protein kinase domain-containing protein [Endozoicomonas arenosclerae]|uniref:protein kinase domain-containing protein n=1 Tax=Endozoicomonas arenosclerae TaxID=1633495 RepID=UPI0007809CF1|nr:protein kinase [Endozoicomonas arenosclerae]
MQTISSQGPASTIQAISSLLMTAVSNLYGYFCSKPVCIAELVTPYMSKRGSFQNENCALDFSQAREASKPITVRKSARSEVARDEIGREKLCLSQIESDHVVQLLEETENSITMNDAGMDLMDLMSELQGPLPGHIFRAVSTQFAQGLLDTHNAGVCHNDLKPDNLAIDADGVVRIIDFGHASSPSADLGMPGEFGTDGYKAPEYFHAPEELSEQSDIFAAGVTLCELLTGNNFMPAATSSMNAAQVNTKICEDQNYFERYVTSYLKNTASKLGRYKPLIAQMLSWDPSKRPTAEQFQAALKELHQ